MLWQYNIKRRDKERFILGINMGQNFGEMTHEQEQKLESQQFPSFKSIYFFTVDK